MKKTLIIAEAGVNHNGSLEMAKKLVDAAFEADADIVKFQTFKSEKVISRFALKAEYQVKTTGSDESQLEMVKKLELTDDDHQVLIEHCQKRGIEFLSTPFDLESADLLVQRFQLRRIKIPSGEITNAPLLLKLSKAGVNIIMSTGMSNIDEIKEALSVLAFGYSKNNHKPSLSEFKRAYEEKTNKKILTERVSLLHCTTEYPAPFNEVNLRNLETLRNEFGLHVGLSDHTVGYSVPVAAVALGAEIIEKHFTLDKNLPGPDHKASLEPADLKTMVDSIRQVEKAMGTNVKESTPSEIKNKPIARKSLIASHKIRKGEPFTEANLTTKRPGTGISPMLYWEYLGRPAKRDFESDEVIE